VSVPLLARAAQFQAAWYFSLLLFAILLLIVLGAAYALVGIRSMWRTGERGPAAVLLGVVMVSLLALGGMYATAIGGLIITNGGGGS
jgi:hypothetical protein